MHLVGADVGPSERYRWIANSRPMARSPSDWSKRNEDRDRFGLDKTENELTDLLGRFVPQRIAQRVIRVSVSVPDHEFSIGDPVPFTVEIQNGLPVPVTVRTPSRRLWGWKVDGDLAASDEPAYAGDTAGEFSLEGGDFLRIERKWSGRFKRTGQDGERTEYVLPQPGTHEITAFVATKDPRPSGSVEIELRG
jgi:hypothetical protein